LGCLFKLVTTAFSLFFFFVVASGGLAAFLVFNGTPQPCVDRSAQPAPSDASDLLADWLNAIEAVSNGDSAKLTINEEQASIIGQGYLDSRDVPVDDLRVYFCPDGTAEATGRVSTGFLGLGSNILVKGTLETDGPTNRLDIDEVHVGQFPDFLASRVYDLLVDENDIRNLPLVQDIEDIEYRDGEAIVTIAP
jgi:hypothetical protein